jgi:Predicted periplasmic lipoprotein (DUF2279)
MKNSILLFLLLCQITFAQDSLTVNPEKSNTLFTRKNVSILALSGAYATTLIASYSMWWRDGNRNFSFFKPERGQGWLGDHTYMGIDKAGHFYTSYFFYRFSKNLLEWGGYPECKSKNIAALLSFGLGVIVEVGDGFSKYGFDYQDLTFNTLGLGYGYLQDAFPVLQNINFKWSYIPTHNFHFPPNLTSTYEAHIYWLTANVHNLLPESVENMWPEFLQVGAGFSISDDYKRREFVIGFDFDLTKLFKSDNKDWNLLINAANMLHFPAPGIKFSNGKQPDYKLLILN